MNNYLLVGVHEMGHQAQRLDGVQRLKVPQLHRVQELTELDKLRQLFDLSLLLFYQLTSMGVMYCSFYFFFQLTQFGKSGLPLLGQGFRRDKLL